jgi:hypothetical protein
MVSGTVKEAVPVAGFASNFSPMERMAPPPVGRVMGELLANDCGAIVDERVEAAEFFSFVALGNSELKFFIVLLCPEEETLDDVLLF